jgi:plasmid maintenance system antidote protein VapI
MSAQFWLNLQTVWDLFHAKHSVAGRQIAKLKRHPALAGAR